MAKVLVIDDMKTVRLQIGKICSNLGVKDIHFAEDGQKAWEMLSEGLPVDLIISDFNMPNMSGGDLLMKLKEVENLAKIPFIFVTAEADKSKVLTFLQMGVLAYIIKPFRADMVQERIKEILTKIKAL